MVILTILPTKKTAMRGLSKLYILLFFFHISNNGYTQNNEDDIFNKALKELKLQKKDIGFEQHAYWTAYPAQVPHKFQAFDELFENPIELYDFSKSIADPLKLFYDSVNINRNYSHLYKTFYYTALSNHISGFRGYEPKLYNPVSVISNLEETLQSLYTISGYYENISVKKRPHKKSNSHESLKAIPSDLKTEINYLLSSIAIAYQWQQKAIRNLDRNKMEAVFNVRDFSLSQYDGKVYYPEFDDCAKNIDKESLFYSSSILLSAIDNFIFRCDSILKSQILDLSEINVELFTPIGSILINGSMDDEYNSDSNKLLIIDFGGNDIYFNSVAAAASIDNPISVLIDFEGNDKYVNSNPMLTAQATGIFGSGILIDMHGDDEYESVNYSQGIGVFGLGFLYDFKGNDTYHMANSGQGCGYFGIGINMDIFGDDRYYIFGDGQGMGGAGGIGILGNFSGNDVYTAEWDAEKFPERADYHSNFKVQMNYAQGAGVGRRGDLTDGHNWAGGIGALIDMNGDDSYNAGNFSQGLGYWFGLGILFDEKGNDSYNSVYFTQASGAHFAMGVLIDQEGDDTHILNQTGGAGLSFGWDFVNTLFIDKMGNDIYEAKMISIANSMLRSNSFFIEMQGDDIYRCGKLENFLGAASFDGSFEKPSFHRMYAFENQQTAFFIDLSGNDTYEIKKDDKWQKHPTAKDNTIWFQPSKDQSLNGKNYGIGFDTDNGKTYLFDN
jgi:hypothetical protein